MPFSRKFRNGMGFPKEGQIIDGFMVESVSVNHINITGGYYEYPTEIIVKGEGNKKAVRKAFRKFYRERRTLFSGYGNPYQCRHGKIEIQSIGTSRFSIKTQGTCVRVYLRDELVRFMEYLYEKKPFPDDFKKAERQKAVSDYINKYIRSSSRKNPFFS